MKPRYDDDPYRPVYFKPIEIVGLKEEFVKTLDSIRFTSNIPIVITRGKDNSDIGVKKSAHHLGLAIDARSGSWYNHFRLVLGAIQNGIKRIGVYIQPFNCPHCSKLIDKLKPVPGHIHIDDSKEHPREVLWVGISK